MSCFGYNYQHSNTGPVAESVASPPADPGVAILARSHTFVEIGQEIISTVILLHSLIQEGWLSYEHEVLVNRICPGHTFTDHLAGSTTD